MDTTDFNDAFLDSTYLKLDEGALSFIFTPARVKAATAQSVDEADALLKKHQAPSSPFGSSGAGDLIQLALSGALSTGGGTEVRKIYGDTTKRILIEAFYIELFEELAEQPDEVAYAFINLCLRRIEDPVVEEARVAEVRKYQAKRKPKA